MSDEQGDVTEHLAAAGCCPRCREDLGECDCPPAGVVVAGQAGSGKPASPGKPTDGELDKQVARAVAAPGSVVGPRQGEETVTAWIGWAVLVTVQGELERTREKLAATTRLWEAAQATSRDWHEKHDTAHEALMEARDERDTLLYEVERARQALEAFATRGIHADPNPTLGGVLGDGHDPGRWYGYLRDADQTVRVIARAALAELSTPSLSGERAVDVDVVGVPRGLLAALIEQTQHDYETTACKARPEPAGCHTYPTYGDWACPGCDAIAAVNAATATTGGTR